MKRKTLLTVIAILTLGCSMPVYAQPKTMPDGTVFDAEYYANSYPDVKDAFGNDETALYNHYVQYGKSEGRLPVSDSADADTTENTATNTPNINNKTVVSKAARLHPRTKETEFWITTYSDGSKMRETNKEYYFHGDFPEQYFIPRTDFSDGLLDADGNGIDDRDPYNDCGYTDLDFNCVADERQAYVKSITPDNVFPGAEMLNIYRQCKHGVVGQGSELCEECQASMARLNNIRAE